MEESLWAFRRECNIVCFSWRWKEIRKKEKEKKNAGFRERRKCRDLCNTGTQMLINLIIHTVSAYKLVYFLVHYAYIFDNVL